MIWKYLFLAALTSILITASDPYFGISFSTSVPEAEDGEVRELSWTRPTSYERFLKDHDDRIDDIFSVSPYFEPSVYFWFLIYTQFESSQVVLHDKSDLNIIYKVLDFSKLRKQNLNNNVIYILQQKVAKEKLEELKDVLEHLADNPYSLEAKSKALYKSLAHSGIHLPVKREDRVAYFKKLRKNVRSQTGQKNFIRDGIIRSLPYQPFLRKFFRTKGLPSELLAIPFLESSFNPRAHSRVSAVGAWQFMPFIASYFMPKRTNKIDYRFNVGVASVSAALLMRQNFQIMKSWDLAVTAYNSGPKHLLKTKRELASDDVNLEDIINHSDSQHFGFASKNFYSEFLALVHTLAYQEELYTHLHDHDRQDVNDDLRFYLTKCLLRLPRHLTPAQLDDVGFHNHQIKDPKQLLPRGSIITTKGPLPSGKFMQLNEKQISALKPKDWSRYLGRQSCSTR